MIIDMKCDNRYHTMGSAMDAGDDNGGMLPLLFPSLLLLLLVLLLFMLFGLPNCTGAVNICGLMAPLLIVLAALLLTFAVLVTRYTPDVVDDATAEAALPPGVSASTSSLAPRMRRPVVVGGEPATERLLFGSIFADFFAPLRAPAMVLVVDDVLLFDDVVAFEGVVAVARLVRSGPLRTVSRGGGNGGDELSSSSSSSSSSLSSSFTLPIMT
jgi:hypothetical protein